MVMLRNRMFLRTFVFLIAIVVVSVCTVGPTLALTDKQLNIYGQNSIFFYDPDASGCDFGESADIDEMIGSDGASYGAYDFERLREATRKYGEYAMSMQEKYGVPWEVVLAQMAVESSVGTAGIAVSGATNNWLGITGSGDAGTWYSSTGRAWAKFSSVEASIEAWAGKKVLRNGYYDDAFSYLDPSNYNLHGFLVTMISHYAPSSDGNNEAAYVASVEKYINGSIRIVREEEGWLSSAEYAAQNNVAIGGKNPLGSSMVNINTINFYDFVSSSACLNKNEGGNTPGKNGLVEPKNLVSGGMTLAEAQAFMQPYIERARLKETGTVVFDGATVNQPSSGPPPAGTLNNCSAFSQWFVNRYTSATVSLYQGSATARALINSGQGFVDGGHTPKVYAVMSSQNPNHTGIVLGIDADSDTIIIGEASYHNGTNGYPRAKAYKLSTYTSSNYTYAYTDGILGGL